MKKQTAEKNKKSSLDEYLETLKKFEEFANDMACEFANDDAMRSLYEGIAKGVDYAISAAKILIKEEI